jgi:hypothetical protein
MTRKEERVNGVAPFCVFRAFRGSRLSVLNSGESLVTVQRDIARYHAGGHFPLLPRHSCLPALRLEVICPFRFPAARHTIASSGSNPFLTDWGSIGRLGCVLGERDRECRTVLLARIRPRCPLDPWHQSADRFNEAIVGRRATRGRWYCEVRRRSSSKIRRDHHLQRVSPFLKQPSQAGESIRTPIDSSKLAYRC